jgi:hypothetical protein
MVEEYKPKRKEEGEDYLEEEFDEEESNRDGEEYIKIDNEDNLEE